jgi:hypothetical protein
MSGFRPVNASKLRQSVSIDSQDSSAAENIPPRRRSLPFRKGAMAKDYDSDESGPAITKSVLRGSTGGLNAKSQLLSDITPGTKRQRLSPAGDYASTGVNGHGSTKKSSSRSSLIVKLHYRTGPASRNEPPPLEDCEVFVTGQGLIGQMATPMRKTHKGVPARVDALDPLDGYSVVQVASGPTHCAALTSGGTVVTW